MPKRERTNAGETVKRSLADQMDGLSMFAYPAGSQPRPASEQSADKIVATGRAKSLRLLALERIARTPVTADQLRGELEEALGHEVAANSIAPRLTELVSDGFASYDGDTARKTRYGATAGVYRVTVKGLELLREREAKRQTDGGSFEHPQEIRP